MNKKLKQTKKLGYVKKIIVNKYISYKSDIKEKVGEENLIKISKVAKTISVFFTFMGFVSSVITIRTFFVKSDDSIALDNYQRGINYLENGYYKDAEKCFESTYKINSHFFDIKYYYAYTEMILENFDKGHKILVENRDSLNENEMAVLAACEYRNKNYKKSQQCMNEIQKPEELEIHAFNVYILYSIELGFLYNYNDGLSVLSNNLILLEAKLNVANVLPEGELEVRDFKDFNLDKEGIQETINRIKDNGRKDISILVNGKLNMYLAFIYYSIQYNEITIPIFYFNDIAEFLDFPNHPAPSLILLHTIYLYTFEFEIYPDTSKEMKEVYKTISDKFHELESLEKENILEIKEENRQIMQRSRQLLELFATIYEEIENGTFDRYSYDAWRESTRAHSRDELFTDLYENIEKMIY